MVNYFAIKIDYANYIVHLAYFINDGESSNLLSLISNVYEALIMEFVLKMIPSSNATINGYWCELLVKRQIKNIFKNISVFLHLLFAF